MGGVVHDVLDPDSERGRVYRCLVGRPRALVTDLAHGAGLDEDTVLAVLRDLAEEGVAVAFDTAGSADDRDHAWEALPPGRVVETVLQLDALRQATARRAGAELERLYRFARQDTGS